MIPTVVFATGGGLRKASIKTCSDGVTYGLHGDGNGGTHWHRAATNGNNSYTENNNYVPPVEVKSEDTTIKEILVNGSSIENYQGKYGI